jgi:DNA-binding transcriptional regulator YiaG
MAPCEIQELMDLRHWSRTQLAAALDVTEPTIHSWMSERRVPGGPAVILMRMWLEQCRLAKSTHTANGHARPARKTVGVK